MSALPQSIGLEAFPQLRGEWRWEDGHLRHTHSSDLAVVKLLAGVAMREMDQLSSREAYSFPFCPRVYRYAMGSNRLSDACLSFDLEVLVEHVPLRVSNQSSREAQLRLAGKVPDLLRCFEYLHQRYGAFHIRKQMLGWTDLGLVRAWMHSDFARSCPQLPAGSQQEMLADLLVALEDSGVLTHLRGRQFSTFQAMREYLEQPKEELLPLSRKEALRSMDNLSQNGCHSHTDESELFRATQVWSNCRKNITFSYSNKNLNINDKFLRENSTKRNSIAAIEDLNHSKVLTLKKEITFGYCQMPTKDQPQTNSMKAIYPQRRMDKKYSFYHHPTAIAAAGLKFTDCFTFKPVERQEQSRLDLMRTVWRDKPELLHYSTSTNPYSKFINKRVPEDQSHSSLDQRQDSANESAGEKDEAGNAVRKASWQREGCEQVREDLDALFDSQHDYDQNELEGELDNMFL